MTKDKNIAKKIFVSITGNTAKEWQGQLKELERRGITEAALFLEQYPIKQRREIYKALESSSIKKIPLIHIRNDMSRQELAYLSDRYNDPYLTIHESSFKYLKKWQGFHKRLYLEMNMDNHLRTMVKVGKVGGFCVDLSHFKSAEEKWSKEFIYIAGRKKHKKYFACNHVNGYSYQKNRDIHIITDIHQFDYLKTLPRFVFGKVIAIETANSIKEQLKFKGYLAKLLG